MFTKFIKIVQLLLLYCVIVQNYVIHEDRSQTEDADSSQNLCKYIDEGPFKFELNLYSFLWVTYKWSSSMSYTYMSKVFLPGGRSFNEPSLEDQKSSMPVEESDNKMKNQKIVTVKDIQEHILPILIELETLKDNIKQHTNSSQETWSYFRKTSFDGELLRFSLMIYQWTSDLLTLYVLDRPYEPSKESYQFPKECQLLLHKQGSLYLLQMNMISSLDLTNAIKSIQTHLYTRLEKRYHWRTEGLIKRGDMLTDFIVTLVNKIHTLFDTKETISEKITFGLAKRLFELQLIAYEWVLKIRYPNLFHKQFDKKNFQPPLESQSSLPMVKNDESKDLETNTADALERESRSTMTEGIDVSSQKTCNFKRTIHYQLEIKLFTFAWISWEWFIHSYGSNIEGRSFNDFQLSLDDRSYLSPLEEGSNGDEEITMKDFIDDIKLMDTKIKRQLNENLKISEKNTMGTDDSSQRSWNVEDHTHMKRSERDSLNYSKSKQLKFLLAVHRWVSSLLIQNTIGKTSLGDIFPAVRDCKPMFPIKEFDEQIRDYQIKGDEILTFIKQIQSDITNSQDNRHLI